MSEMEMKYFRFQIVESAKVKLRKPDPAIFEYVMKLVNVSPAECIFLDDIQENIMAAKDLGIYAIKVIK